MEAIISVAPGTEMIRSLLGVAKYDVEEIVKFVSYWAVEISAQGFLAWGPLKYRPNANRTHSGISLVEIFDKRCFWKRDNVNEVAEAEEYALTRAMELESKGFRVKLEFPGCDNSYRNSSHRWLKDAPPNLLIKRIVPTIGMIFPRRP